MSDSNADCPEALLTNIPANRDETTRTCTRTTVHLPTFLYTKTQLCHDLVILTYLFI